MARTPVSTAEADALLGTAASAGRAVARLARHLDRALEPFELSLSQFRVLGFLARGSSGSTSLAEHLSVRPPSVTSVVDGLVARGLVVRASDPTDRRRLSLELSAAGRKVFLEADATIEARLSAIAAFMGAKATKAMDHLAQWHLALDAYRDHERAAEAARAR